MGAWLFAAGLSTATAQMNILLQTTGLQMGDLRIPSFTLCTGEWIALSWPLNFGSHLEKQFYASLCDTNRNEFIVLSQISIVTPFGASLNLGREGSNRQIASIEHFLHCLSLDDRDMLMAELQERNLSPDSRLDHLPGTLRLLAGLCMASIDSKVIVFNIAGVDPLGIQKVYAYIMTKLKQDFSFIELVFPVSGDDQQRPIIVKRLNAVLQLRKQ